MSNTPTAGLHMCASYSTTLPVVCVLNCRQLRCPPGSAKVGELDVSHMNSWSHATNYPPIILSGLVDLVNLYLVGGGKLASYSIQSSSTACSPTEATCRYLHALGGLSEAL
jgi:hypothetical protein